MDFNRIFAGADSIYSQWNGDIKDLIFFYDVYENDMDSINNKFMSAMPPIP